MPLFIEELRKRLSVEDVVQLMEAGIFAHFHIARIHPFEDGNGRTARILQDVILNHYKFPLPVIEAGERSAYFYALKRAIREWNENNNWEPNSKITLGEREFYSFIAGKINVSLDHVLDGIY